jgi:NAD(P)-dependent dehydrogenase (short-subunit alcohol dehydrogenase family)
LTDQNRPQINNAGIATPSSMPSLSTRDELRTVFDVNVFGVVAVTNAFLPLLAPPTRPASSTFPARSPHMLDNPESPMYRACAS